MPLLQPGCRKNRIQGKQITVVNSFHRAYVFSIIRCALVDDYVAYYLPLGCRRYDLVRSFTTLTKLLQITGMT
jgi:hypothetical protein